MFHPFILEIYLKKTNQQVEDEQNGENPDNSVLLLKTEVYKESLGLEEGEDSKTIQEKHTEEDPKPSLTIQQQPAPLA